MKRRKVGPVAVVVADDQLRGAQVTDRGLVSATVALKDGFKKSLRQLLSSAAFVGRDVVLGLDHGAFEEALEIAKEDKGVHLDTDLDAGDWQRLVGRYKALVEEQLGRPFPEDPQDQLWGAIGAVFGSWEGERARTYRRLHHIPHDRQVVGGVAVPGTATRGITSGEACYKARCPRART